MTFGNLETNPFADGNSTSETGFDAPRGESSATLIAGNNAKLTLGHEFLTIADEGLKNKSSRSCWDIVIPSHPESKQSIPYFNILWAEISQDSLTIKYAKPTSKVDVVLATICYSVEREQKSIADAWVESLLNLAYGDAQRKKRIKVLVNPFGGKGYAPKYYYKDVEPIFVAARCDVDPEITDYQGHAIDIAEKIDIDAYDVIAACSGDGVLCEIFNGLGKKSNAGEALSKVAVAHIPCGSGNAMSWNLNGTGSASMAALCIIKGLRTPLDLVSITQGERRTLSFLSQSFGIIADSDLGTDHLRWMGSVRFTFGFLVRLFGNTVYPCDIAVKVEIDDKKRIKEHYNAIAQQKSATDPRGDLPESGGLPPLRYGSTTDPIPSDWERISYDKLGNFYAGNMAFMLEGANFFPATLPNDGFLDLITIRGDLSRMTALHMLKAVDTGTLFDMPDVSVQKVSGYRVTPKDRDDGYISIDGEQVPFEPFQAEVHKGLGTVISKSGYRYETNGMS